MILNIKNNKKRKIKWYERIRRHNIELHSKIEKLEKEQIVLQSKACEIRLMKEAGKILESLYDQSNNTVLNGLRKNQEIIESLLIERLELCIELYNDGKISIRDLEMNWEYTQNKVRRNSLFENELEFLSQKLEAIKEKIELEDVNNVMNGVDNITSKYEVD